MSTSIDRPASRLVCPWACGLLLLALGCGAQDVTTPNPPPVPVADAPTPEEPAEPKTPEPATEPATEPHEATIGGFRFNVPAGWKEVPLNEFQRGILDARFEIPAAGEDVSLTLSTVGGGVEANVARWIGQFTPPAGVEPKTESLSVDGIDVTWVELQGTFKGMGGPFSGAPPQSDWMMLGAAFQGSPQDFYIKLTGPAGAVEDLKEDFRKFVESARAQQ